MKDLLSVSVKFADDSTRTSKFSSYSDLKIEIEDPPKSPKQQEFAFPNSVQVDAALEKIGNFLRK